MTERIRACRVAHNQLEVWFGKVIAEGGELRILHGNGYGLATSVMESEVVPGGGPRPHKHPHAEIFVLYDGEGRYEVEGAVLTAAAGDVVIVPPDAWHRFENPGPGLLRQTVIHESPRIQTMFEDGSIRD